MVRFISSLQSCAHALPSLPTCFKSFKPYGGKIIASSAIGMALYGLSSKVSVTALATRLSTMLYTNGALTALGGGVIGTVGTLVLCGTGFILYRRSVLNSIQEVEDFASTLLVCAGHLHARLCHAIGQHAVQNQPPIPLPPPATSALTSNERIIRLVPFVMSSIARVSSTAMHMYARPVGPAPANQRRIRGGIGA